MCVAREWCLVPPSKRRAEVTTHPLKRSRSTTTIQQCPDTSLRRSNAVVDLSLRVLVPQPLGLRTEVQSTDRNERRARSLQYGFDALRGVLIRRSVCDAICFTICEECWGRWEPGSTLDSWWIARRLDGIDAACWVSDVSGRSQLRVAPERTNTSAGETDKRKSRCFSSFSRSASMEMKKVLLWSLMQGRLTMMDWYRAVGTFQSFA